MIESMLALYLAPFTLLKYILAGVLWVFLVQSILQTDVYYQVREWLSDRYDEYKEKKNPHMPDDYLSADYKKKKK